MEEEIKEEVDKNKGPMPLYYANNATVGVSLTDLSILGTFNNSPACNLVMPFETAKTLLHTLAKAISEHERKKGETIKTISELSKQIMK